MFAPEAYTEASFRAEGSRAASDRRQVPVLKAQAWKAAAEAFVAR
jgi:hypothetical protein